MQRATPDAVARLVHTKLATQADQLWEIYFGSQEHSSLTAFLRKVLTTEERKLDQPEGTLIQVRVLWHMYLSTSEVAHIFFTSSLNYDVLCILFLLCVSSEKVCTFTWIFSVLQICWHLLIASERNYTYVHFPNYLKVTTHARLLSSNDLKDISSATSLPLSNVSCLSLQQFHTEQQFCSSVRWGRFISGRSNARYLFVW